MLLPPFMTPAEVLWEDCTSTCSYFPHSFDNKWLSNTSLYHCDKLPSLDSVVQPSVQPKFANLPHIAIFQPLSNLMSKHLLCSLDPRQVRLQASKSFTEPKTL